MTLHLQFFHLDIRDFNPHLPCGRWRARASRWSWRRNFNPHLPYGRWREVARQYFYDKHFNPHLPYGRWLISSSMCAGDFYFNPHLPYGRWPYTVFLRCWHLQFQSTPSLRKVTVATHIRPIYFTHFNPHLPYGRWLLYSYKIAYPVEFQSTPSLRKVTKKQRLTAKSYEISIHTFLTEGDLKNIYNYFFIMHIFMHYILSYL